MSFRGWIGLDGAVGYTLLARAANMASSTVTVLLIVRYLSPIEQGYYYTLLSLVSLQTVFEMGFSFVIQQLAAHECAHLEAADGGADGGGPAARLRLAATLKLTLRWYSYAALGIVLIVLPAGFLFFSSHSPAGSAAVSWQGPWACAVLAASLGLWCTPLYAFLEGCGEIRRVARLRFEQSLLSSLFAWAPFLLGHGLYSPALVIVGQTAAGSILLVRRSRFFAELLGRDTTPGCLSWFREVWPFQWRIAISSISAYFTLQIFIPILFAARGPREAGQMGMSLSIVTYMTVLALAWTSTKATLFGRMIARREFRDAEQLLLSMVVRSLSAFGVLSIAAIAGASVLPALDSGLADRMVPARLLALLILAAAGNLVVQSLAIYLRAFKREPFVRQSLIVAALTLALTAAAAPALGTSGAAASYFAATGVAGLPMALCVFSRARRSYLSMEGVP